LVNLIVTHSSKDKKSDEEKKMIKIGKKNAKSFWWYENNT
jgi:hypothetical protein